MKFSLLFLTCKYIIESATITLLDILQILIFLIFQIWKKKVWYKIKKKEKKKFKSLDLHLSLQRFFIPSSNREHYHRHATLNDPDETRGENIPVVRHRFHGMRSKNRGSRRSPDHFKRHNCSASERSESRRFHGPSSTVNPLWRAARHKDPFASIETEGKGEGKGTRASRGAPLARWKNETGARPYWKGTRYKRARGGVFIKSAG